MAGRVNWASHLARLLKPVNALRTLKKDEEELGTVNFLFVFIRKTTHTQLMIKTYGHLPRDTDKTVLVPIIATLPFALYGGTGMHYERMEILLSVCYGTMDQVCMKKHLSQITRTADCKM